MKLPLTVLKDKSAPAAALALVAIRQYGVECFEWTPQILRNELEKDYNVELSDLQSDKLQAAITILTSDAFETNWHVFQTICRHLTGQPMGFEDFEPLDPEEIVYALTDATLIRHEPIEFDDEINAYCGKVFHDYGFCNAPDLFPTAIMPPCPGGSDDTEKNEALTELFQERLAELVAYIEDMS